MTKEQLNRAFEMRMEGATYDEIGSCMGISRQAVHEALHRAMKSEEKRWDCAYPGLKRWMIDHEINRNQLAKAIKPEKSACWIYEKLHGSGSFSITEIRAILDYTGLSFEQAFGEVIGRC